MGREAEAWACTFDEIVAGKGRQETYHRGSRDGVNAPPPLFKGLTCKDGTTLSVQASRAHYCHPRNNWGPYMEVEVGYPRAAWGNDAIQEFAKEHGLDAISSSTWLLLARMTAIVPKGWAPYCDDWGDGPLVFVYVPVELVRAFIEEHGGEADNG